MLPLITTLPTNCELILTPYKIKTETNSQYSIPVRKITTRAYEFYEYPGFAPLIKHLQEHDIDVTYTETPAYLMAGELRVAHTHEQYVFNLPHYAGLIFPEEPELDYRRFADVYIKAPQGVPLCTEIANGAYIQNSAFRHMQKFSGRKPLEITWGQIIPTPDEDSIREALDLSVTVVIPQEIYNAG